VGNRPEGGERRVQGRPFLRNKSLAEGIPCKHLNEEGCLVQEGNMQQGKKARGNFFMKEGSWGVERRGGPVLGPH